MKKLGMIVSLEWDSVQGDASHRRRPLEQACAGPGGTGFRPADSSLGSLN